ncbi:MAG: hypothetical protein V4592_12260 [Bacteroidota bacterium]
MPRNSKISLLLLIILLAGINVFAQMGTPVDSTTVNAVMKQCAIKYPKFYRELNDIKAHDKLIKNFVFVRYTTDTGPAKAGPLGNVFIDIKYLETEQPNFGDDRLIVVLYHEIGHLHYFMNVPPANRNAKDSEQAAFEYSLLKTKELAEKGDCLPLKTGLKFMKLRSEGTNLQDPHVIALKRMVQEPLYFSYLEYVKAKCP